MSAYAAHVNKSMSPSVAESLFRLIRTMLLSLGMDGLACECWYKEINVGGVWLVVHLLF